MKAVLIIGCGDVGLRVARLSSPAPVTGVVRSSDRASRLRASGVDARILDLDAPFSGSDLPAADSELYYFAPPPARGATDPRVAAVCSVLRGRNRPSRLVYISTSAVYGDCGGDWIDESAALKPGTDRGRRRLDAERRFLLWGKEQQVPVVVLRVPGIYGPGRLPIERLREGLPVLSAEASPYTNRIHVDDLAHVCIAAMRRGRAGEAYNVSDGNPGSMTDYFNRVADAMGVPRPPVVSRELARQTLSPSMMSFLSESKRLINRKMLDELGVRLRYESLDEGLAAAIADAGDSSGQDSGSGRPIA
ncbi:MAG: SDR family oxidoreductase [Thiogranum sp.]|nr:SDR family oxidoreductase [Thiogranum sp.]